jgi:hypothetical protein
MRPSPLSDEPSSRLVAEPLMRMSDTWEAFQQKLDEYYPPFDQLALGPPAPQLPNGTKNS